MQPHGENAAPTYSDVALFLQAITNEGRAAVSAELSNVSDADALPILEKLDTYAREELALELPARSPNVALWAARLCYQLSRFIVCRDIPAEQIAATCNIACPEPRNPETDWSADLTLRHLPSLFQLARHLSNGDPLVQQMTKIAADWPLSSVGIPGLEKLQINSFVGHDGLRRLYGDRVLTAADISRLGDARLDDVLRADLGIHRDLVPVISTKLFEHADDTR